MTLTGVVHEAVQIVRPCKGCKKPMINPHKLKVYCGGTCRMKHKRPKPRNGTSAKVAVS